MFCLFYYNFCNCIYICLYFMQNIFFSSSCFINKAFIITSWSLSDVCSTTWSNEEFSWTISSCFGMLTGVFFLYSWKEWTLLWVEAWESDSLQDFFFDSGCSNRTMFGFYERLFLWQKILSLSRFILVFTGVDWSITLLAYLLASSENC